MDLLLQTLRDAALAFIVAAGFAILFNTPRRVLMVAGLLGGLGHAIRFLLMSCDMGLIFATLSGAVAIGLIGIPCAHHAHAPPVVFTMPACITMIPGLYAYRTMLGCIKITDLDLVKRQPDLLQNTAHYFVLTASLLFALAIGICSGALIFRKDSAKSLFKRML